MPRDDVDRPAFCPDREGRLWDDGPARVAKLGEDRVYELSMIGIEKTVEALAVPLEPHDESRTDSRGDRFQGVDGQAISSPTLDAGDG